MHNNDAGVLLSIFIKYPLELNGDIIERLC